MAEPAQRLTWRVTVGPVQVLKSRDGVWRLEQRRDGCWLYMHGGLVLSRASLDQVARYLLEAGVDIGDLVAD